MNLPFTLLDILERLMPGAIVLGLLLLFQPTYFPDGMAQARDGEDAVLLGSIFVALSYSLGVVFNLLAGLSNWLDRKLLDRRDLNSVEGSDAKRACLRKAFSAVFHHDITAESWRLCYGIAEKSGYGIRVELFSSLNMFCRSMFVGMLVLAVMFAIEIRYQPAAWLAAAGFALCAAIFAQGACVYSRAFSAAIFEAFQTWYYVEKSKEPVPQAGAPASQ